MSDGTSWELLGHRDALKVLHDWRTFRNRVSAHRSVPNGLDPPEHDDYRAAILPLLSPERVAAFAPRCRTIVARTLVAARRTGRVDWMRQWALPLAAELQCAYLGFPEDLQQALMEWSLRSAAATRAGDRQHLAGIAAEFEELSQHAISRWVDEADPAADNITRALCAARVLGHPMSAADVASVLRNWTAGELGTMAAATGILLHFIATDEVATIQMRTQPDRLAEASDEILRLHGPLLANRRRATRNVEIAGQRITAGERLQINWVAVNRDPEVFEQPHCFRLGRRPADNLLYGAGIHQCPGAALSRLVLSIFLEEALSAAVSLDGPPCFAQSPASGFARLPLRFAETA
ncbi:cytochrome P450 [Algiphilus aromaticivorans]|uniref:cytochrome P450 n=1 Tax=Algiphilus aromaticivorans TaxID=382454 RepID=UPI000693F3C8|nr:cytochrome P450 [Algiphilus aromaticivorans]